MSISRIQIFGERNSGTNLIEHLLRRNFSRVELCWDFGWKHFFPKRSNLEIGSTIVIVIYRNPIDWTKSMFRNPWHADPRMRSMSFSDFIRSDWIASEDSICAEAAGWKSRPKNIEVDPKTGKVFSNLLQMRTAKIEAFEAFRSRAQNNLSIRYEIVAKDKLSFIEMLERNFCLHRNKKLDLVSDYKGGGFWFVKNTLNKVNWFFRKSSFNKFHNGSSDYEFFKSQLNWELEKKIGYSDNFPHGCL